MGEFAVIARKCKLSDSADGCDVWRMCDACNVINVVIILCDMTT